MSSVFSRRTVLQAGVAVTGLGLIGTRPVFAQTSGTGLLERLRQAKVIKVATVQNPPFSEYKADGSFDGLAAVVTQTAMERIGVPKLDVVVLNFGELIPGLLAGRYDMVATTLIATKPRCEQVLYCSPINFDPNVVAYLPTMANPPKTMAEIGQRKLKVAVVSGGYQLPTMLKLTDKELITTVPGVTDLIDVLLAGRVDVSIGNNGGYMAQLKNRPGAFKYHAIPDIASLGAGPVFRKTDTDFYEAFDREVRAMKASGFIDETNKRFGLPYDRESGDKIHGKEVCEMAV